MHVHKNAVRLAQLLATLGLASAVPVPGMAQTPRHGEIRAMEAVRAWDSDVGAWVSPEQFWLNSGSTLAQLWLNSGSTTRIPVAA